MTLQLITILFLLLLKFCYFGLNVSCLMGCRAFLQNFYALINIVVSTIYYAQATRSTVLVYFMSVSEGIKAVMLYVV